MSDVTSSLSNDQEKKLLSLFGHVRLHLLYKASVHGFTAAAFHSRCDQQGPTLIAAFNAAGCVYGAYTSKDYTQSEQAVSDSETFLYGISAARPEPLKVDCGVGQPAFTDVKTGPDYGALVFLADDRPAVLSNPGTNFNFQAADIYGGDLALTELEVYRVEGWCLLFLRRGNSDLVGCLVEVHLCPLCRFGNAAEESLEEHTVDSRVWKNAST